MSNQRSKEEPESLWPLVTVAAVLAVAVFVMSLSVNWWGNTVFRSAIVTALVLVVLADIQIVRDHRRKKEEGILKSDERLQKIFVYASSYSWRIGIFFLIALIFVNLLGICAMDVVVALSVSVFVMAGAFFVFNWYFDRKGDVE